jgi:hypothetical protein
MEDWSGLFLELRENGAQAQKDREWDPVTLSVEGRDDLVTGIGWLDERGSSHSPLLIGVRGWMLVFEVGQPSPVSKTLLTELSRTLTAGGFAYTLEKNMVGGRLLLQASTIG